MLFNEVWKIKHVPTGSGQYLYKTNRLLRRSLWLFFQENVFVYYYETLPIGPYLQTLNGIIFFCHQSVILINPWYLAYHQIFTVSIYFFSVYDDEFINHFKEALFCIGALGGKINNFINNKLVLLFFPMFTTVRWRIKQTKHKKEHWQLNGEKSKFKRNWNASLRTQNTFKRIQEVTYLLFYI